MREKERVCCFTPTKLDCFFYLSDLLAVVVVVHWGSPLQTRRGVMRPLEHFWGLGAAGHFPLKYSKGLLEEGAVVVLIAM